MNSSQSIGSKNRILTNKQILKVNEYALRLMEEIGCRIESEEALDILGRAGCNVSDPSNVKIVKKLVMEAIESAPEKIDVYNTDGKIAMTFREDNCYYGTGSDCPTTIDLYSGERRETTKKDVADIARFCDALPNMDFVMSMAIANDAPIGANFVHQYAAMIKNTKKPIIVTAHGLNDMSAIIDIAAAVYEDNEKVKSNPPIVLYSEPLSPYVHTEMGVSKCLLCCEYEIPFIYISAALMGASAPTTIEGALVQTVAEALTGLVIFQQKQPGAKFIFGGDTSIMDMRTGIFCYGSPELNILNAAIADMSHYYKLPFFCLAGATDSKILDAQAGFEYAMSIYIATLNGCNIIHDLGYLESGLTSSYESILFSDEVVSNIKRLLRPIHIDDETVPFNLMAKVGPGGSFLSEEHTANTFKNNFWIPRYFDRNMYDEWQDSGFKDIRGILNEKAKEIVNKHTPDKLSKNIIDNIEKILSEHNPDVEV